MNISQQIRELVDKGYSRLGILSYFTKQGHDARSVDHTILSVQPGAKPFAPIVGAVFGLIVLVATVLFAVLEPQSVPDLNADVRMEMHLTDYRAGDSLQFYAMAANHGSASSFTLDFQFTLQDAEGTVETWSERKQSRKVEQHRMTYELPEWLDGEYTLLVRATDASGTVFSDRFRIQVHQIIDAVDVLDENISEQGLIDDINVLNETDDALQHSDDIVQNDTNVGDVSLNDSVSFNDSLEVRNDTLGNPLTDEEHNTSGNGAQNPLHGGISTSDESSQNASEQNVGGGGFSWEETEDGIIIDEAYQQQIEMHIARDADLRASVEEALALVADNPEQAGTICGTIAVADIKDLCFNQLAEASHNHLFCQDIESTSIADFCYLNYAMATDDTIPCEYITSNTIREKCNDR